MNSTPGLKMQALSAVFSSNRESFAFEIVPADDGFWKIVAQTGKPDQRYTVLTARGGVKTWRDLGGAIGFIQQSFDECKNVRISIGEWKFARVLNDQ